MGVQTVTILVQAAIILVLIVAAFHYRTKWLWMEGWTIDLRERNRELENALETASRLAALKASKPGPHIATTRPNIPSKPTQEPIIHAKNAAHVRQLTENAFGGKPEDEHVH